jgi:hypothetical protein
MKPVLGILAVLLLLGSYLEATGQEFRITQLKMGPDGSLEWSTGSTVSKSGVAVKFQPNLDKGQIVSYAHEKIGMDALKPGDRIALYITRIKVTGSLLNFRDDAGEKVVAVPGRPGGWRIVTIESITPTPTGVTIKIKEKLNLEKTKAVSELLFQLKNGYLTDVTGN